MPENDLKPKIETAWIGIEEMQEIKIYPLSMADQQSAFATIAEAVRFFTEAEDKADVDFIKGVIDLVMKNFVDILTMVTRGVDVSSLLPETTNEQAVNIGEIIYKNNFAILIQKVSGMVEGVANLGLVPDPEMPLDLLEEDSLKTE